MSSKSNLILLAYHRHEKDRLLSMEEVERLVRREEWMGTHTPSVEYGPPPRPAKEELGVVVVLKSIGDG